MLLLAAGCGSGLEGAEAPNQPPETEITVLPASVEATDFVVSFAWSGKDPDGRVDHFQWRISDNGPDGMVSRQDTLGLPWQGTVALDSSFQVQADLDSFPDDVDDPRQDRHQYRFWQTHTFFLRAVDEKGLADPTPAHASFTATTLAPRVTITQPPPVTSVDCIQSARTLSFAWSYLDPDDLEADPDAVRYVLLNLDDLPEEVQGLLPVEDGRCLDEQDLRQSDLIARLPDRSWSRWIPADAPDDSAWGVTFPRFDPDERLIFAVQARDRAGAVTPTFDWGVNLRHLRTGTSRLPGLKVTEPYLGGANFVGVHGLRDFKVVATQPVHFSWTADAAAYAGIIQAYRYGWDVQDPDDEDDPGWLVPWNIDFTEAPTRTFTDGVHTFVVQVRDNSDVISRGTFQIRVIPIPRREEQRNLLVIDDWGWENTTLEKAQQESWLNRWRSMLELRVEGWNPKEDILRVNLEPGRCDFETLGRYKAIIWFLNGRGSNSELRRVVFPPAGSASFNWMRLYLKEVGNVLMTGIQPMHSATNVFDPDYPLVLSEGGIRLADWFGDYWCVEALDMVRPGLNLISCEQGVLQRTQACDRPIGLTVPEDFLQAYPSANGVLGELQANEARLEDDAVYKLRFEEFYNVNVSCRGVTLNLRPCQKVMYRAVARREAVDPATGEPFVDDPLETCSPYNRTRSPLQGVPMGLAVSANSDTKALPGSEDFLWGFHPLAYRQSGVTAALIWILRERWDLPILFD